MVLYCIPYEFDKWSIKPQIVLVTEGAMYSCVCIARLILFVREGLKLFVDYKYPSSSLALINHWLDKTKFNSIVSRIKFLTVFLNKIL